MRMPGVKGLLSIPVLRFWRREEPAVPPEDGAGAVVAPPDSGPAPALGAGMAAPGGVGLAGGERGPSAPLGGPNMAVAPGPGAGAVGTPASLPITPADGAAPPPPPAGENPAAKSIKDLFAEDDAGNSELRRLATDLPEVDVSGLAGECRQVAAAMKERVYRVAA